MTGRAAGTGESKSAEPASQQTGKLVVKQSNATRVWLAVVMSVLLLIWWQTRNPTSSRFNFFLNGDSVAVGAAVLIDGTVAGRMTAPPNSGLGGAAFYTDLADGRHVVEVRKPGYKSFRKEIDMQTKGYVSVELQPEGKGDDDLDDI
ncbi:MAG TPA: PEGA domain-containing protein [Candidatus Obscuribacterales bacterium]